MNLTFNTFDLSIDSRDWRMKEICSGSAAAILFSSIFQCQGKWMLHRYVQNSHFNAHYTMSGLFCIYVCDLIHFKTDSSGKHMQSVITRAARTRIKFGNRASSVAAPLVWNSLPQSLRLTDYHTEFRRHLKTKFVQADVSLLTLSTLLCAAVLNFYTFNRALYMYLMMMMMMMM